MLTVPIGSGRNDALNRAALRSYRAYLAAGLDLDDVTAALGDADGGLDHRATERTLRSARDAAERQGPAEDAPGDDVAPWEQSDDPFAPHYRPPLTVAGDAAPVDADPSTWQPVDLAPFLDGQRQPVEPDLMPRTDGVCLLYPGAVHSFHGESESGKSLLLQLLAAQLVNDGEPVLFVDFESDPAAIVDRMLTLGATRDAIRARFHYVQPEVRPDASETDRAAWLAMLGTDYRLAIIDGVTDALSVFGYGTKENDDITAWMRSMPKAIAARTGAAVAIIDHVTKDTEGRGRFAIGGQAKMAGLTGAAYTVSIVEPLGRGMRGTIALRIGKDRPGSIRPHCGPFRKTDRTQEAARVIVDDTGPGPTAWTVDRWQQPGASDQPATFRPTALMERVSRFLEDNPESSTRHIREQVSGNERAVVDALTALVDERYVDVSDGPRGAKLHTLARSYRQAADPASDAYRGGTSQHVDAVHDAA